MVQRFRNNVIDTRIADAIKDAERLLTPGSAMYTEIKAKNDWRYNSGSGEEICEKLSMKKDLLPVFTYKPFNPWTRAIGYYDGNAIYINSRKLPSMSHKDIIANCVHEYAHHCSFTHGNNFPSEEKAMYSVPYFLSEGVSRWL